MAEDPADKHEKIIRHFFEILKIEHQFYSIIKKQPMLLIGEKNLCNALKKVLEPKG